MVSVPVIVFTAAACDTPPVKLLPVGTDHVYKVPVGITPFVTFVGVTAKVTPLQTVVLIAVIVAIGLTVTVTVNGVAGPQLLVDGVMIYVAVCAVLVGLNRLPVMVLTAVALAPPVKPPVTPGTDQLYVVPAGTIPLVTSVGVTVNNTPLQLTVLIAVITAVAFNVTVTENTAPVQLPVIGVTR